MKITWNGFYNGVRKKHRAQGAGSSMKNLLLSSVSLFAVLFSLVKVPEKAEWYIAYHRRPKGYTSPNHRETCIEKIVFDNQGFIIPVKITREGVGAVEIKDLSLLLPAKRSYKKGGKMSLVWQRTDIPGQSFKVSLLF